MSLRPRAIPRPWPAARRLACNANIAANGGVFTLNQADFQGISGFDRGNPDLTEEEGNSWTIGVVIQPEEHRGARQVRLLGRLLPIDIDDAIVLTDRNFILSQCYGGGNQSFCNFVTRRPAAVGANSAGSIEFLDADVTNSGGEFAEGVDLTVGFNTPIGPGKFNAQLSYTHLLDHYQIPLPGEDKDQLSGEIGDSDDKAYLMLGYNIGKFGGTLQTTYISSADLDDGFLRPSRYGRRAGFGGNRRSATYLDLQFTWTSGRVVPGVPGCEQHPRRGTAAGHLGTAGRRDGHRDRRGHVRRDRPPLLCRRAHQVLIGKKKAFRAGATCKGRPFFWARCGNVGAWRAVASGNFSRPRCWRR